MLQPPEWRQYRRKDSKIMKYINPNQRGSLRLLMMQLETHLVNMVMQQSMLSAVLVARVMI